VFEMAQNALGDMAAAAVPPFGPRPPHRDGMGMSMAMAQRWHGDGAAYSTRGITKT